MNLNIIKETNLLDKANSDLLYIANAYVGHEAATTLRDFCANYTTNLTPADIINKGLWEKTQKPVKWEINQHMNLITKMMSEGEKNILKKKFSEKQLTNISNYLFCIPAELVMQLWTAIASNNSDNGIAIYSSTASNGRHTSEYIAEVNGIDIAKKTT